MATVSNQLIEDILKTLPIGVYLGDRAQVEFSPGAPTSSFNPLTCKITVSAQNIHRNLKNLPDTKDVEKFVRVALYHELSHMILTPRSIPQSYITPQLNIFEDERIETLFSNYYRDVDFKRAVFLENWEVGGGDNAESAIDFFFDICRFRQGPEQFVSKVNALIERWRNLDSNSGRWDSQIYINEVDIFYQEVEDFWNEDQRRKEEEKAKNDQQNSENSEGSNSEKSAGDNDEKSEQSQEGGQQGKKNASGSESSENEDNGKTSKKSSTSSSENASGKPGKNSSTEDTVNTETGEANHGKPTSTTQNSETSESENVDEGESETEDGTDPAVEKAIEEAKKRTEEVNTDRMFETVKRVFNRMRDQYSNPSTTAEISRIITRACKKRASRCGTFNGYAGKIDPRSVGMRTDYRWFQKSGDSGDKKFDRIHLTLWVDKSGSFCGDIDEVNCLIKSLNDLVDKMPNCFSMDVVTMDCDNQIHDRTKPIVAEGGNNFGPNVEKIHRQLQKAGWSNYNIVVWDGDLGSDKHYYLSEYLKVYEKAFQLFNNQKSIIVSDNDNHKYLDHLTNARMEFISGNYAKEFINVVIRLLDQML